MMKVLENALHNYIPLSSHLTYSAALSTQRSLLERMKLKLKERRNQRKSNKNNYEEEKSHHLTTPAISILGGQLPSPSIFPTS